MRRTTACCVRVLIVTICLAALQQAQTPTMADKQVEIFGQKIHYLEAGSGPAVILLHGLGGDASNWAAAIPALAQKYHVYVPDQIGFGKSDKPMINYRVATLVEFLNEFCGTLGIGKASLVGNSLGGWTAAAFALAYPEKVDRLILVDAAGFSPQRTGTQVTREMLYQLNPSTPQGMKQSLSLILHNKQMLTDQFIKQAFAAKLARNDGYTINMFIESVLRGEDFLDGKLGAINAPTLVLWGREDALTPLAIGKALAEDIRGARLQIIDSCGHVPQLECAGLFNQAVTKFLSGEAAATAR